MVERVEQPERITVLGNLLDASAAQIHISQRGDEVEIAIISPRDRPVLPLSEVEGRLLLSALKQHFHD